MFAPNISTKYFGLKAKLSPYAEHFYDENAPYSQYGCREQFHTAYHNKYSKEKPFNGFYYSTNDLTGLSAMFDWAETVLNLKERTKFNLITSTSKNVGTFVTSLQNPTGPTFVFVHLSPFWRSENIRFYFSTILCRMPAANYRNNLPEWTHPIELVVSNSYTFQTVLATALFLLGNTLITEKAARASRNGWVENLSSAAYISKLAKPTAKEDLVYFENENPTSNLTPYEKAKLSNWVVSKNPHLNFVCS